LIGIFPASLRCNWQKLYVLMAYMFWYVYKLWKNHHNLANEHIHYTCSFFVCVCACVWVCYKHLRSTLSDFKHAAYHATFSLCAHPSVNTGCLLILALVSNAARTWKCRYLYPLISFTLDVYPEVRWLDHMIPLFLIVWRILHTSFHDSYTNTLPPTNVQLFPFLHTPSRYLSFVLW
jgi:hypothetical protein